MGTQIIQQYNKVMETVFGKALLAISWFLAFATGKDLLWVLSAIPSILATISWLLKLQKQLKEKREANAKRKN